METFSLGLGVSINIFHSLHIAQQRVLGVTLLLCFFSRTIIFCFPIGHPFIWSQVLGHLGSVRHVFRLIDQSLLPSKQQLVTPTTFVPILHQHSMSHRQVTIADQRFCSWFGVYLSLLVMYREPSSTMSNCHDSSSSLCSVSHVRIVFSNGILLSVCTDQPISQAIA